MLKAGFGEMGGIHPVSSERPHFDNGAGPPTISGRRASAGQHQRDAKGTGPFSAIVRLTLWRGRRRGAGRSANSSPTALTRRPVLSPKMLWQSVPASRLSRQDRCPEALPNIRVPRLP